MRTEYEFANAESDPSHDYLLPVVKSIIKNAPSRSVIADLGCGNGSMLAQFRGKGFELYGLDMSRSGLDHAAITYTDIDFSYADLTADLSGHPLAGRCDFLISTEVVEHIFLPRSYARNCYLFLKRNGTLIVSTPYHGYFKNIALSITGQMDTHFTALWDYGHIKFWSRRTLSSLLEEAGFSVQRFVGTGRLPLLWKSMFIVATKR